MIREIVLWAPVFALRSVGRCPCSPPAASLENSCPSCPIRQRTCVIGAQQAAGHSSPRHRPTIKWLRAWACVNTIICGSCVHSLNQSSSSTPARLCLTCLTQRVRNSRTSKWRTHSSRLTIVRGTRHDKLLRIKSPMIEVILKGNEFHQPHTHRLLSSW
jgi:hypothetical protein